MGSPCGQMEQLSGGNLEEGALDTPDGQMGVNQASEKLDKQCEKMKVRMLACPHHTVDSLLSWASHHNLLAPKSSEHFSAPLL